MLLTLLKATTGGSVAAPTFTNLTSGAGSAATSFTTASISPTGNRLILVTVHAYISTGSVQPSQPTVTGNGITYALVQAQDVDNAGTDRATMWIFRGMAASPTSGAITISFGATSMTRCAWSVDQSDANVNMSGSNGSGAIYQATGVTLGAAATSASVNFATSMESKNTAFSAWGHQVQEAKTERASWTELADVTSVTLASLETQYIAGTDTAGSATWATSSRAGGILLEIAAPPLLLAEYSFDEASGNILDSSGNGRDVTFGGAFTRVTGHTGKALSQSSAAADSAGPLTGMQTARYTIMGWVNRSNNLVDGWLMEFKQSGSGDRGILFTGGAIQSRCKNVAGTALTASTTQPTANTAYHFAGTNDGVTLRLFINGSEVGTGTAFSGGVRTNSTSSSLFDGCGTETWLDDARYYDGAWDAASITTLMGTPAGGSSGFTGTAAATQAANTSSASGLAGAIGSVAVTQANQTSTASGTVTAPGVSGSASVTQANQTSSASGVLGYTGTSTRTQANQTAAATGTLGYTGTVAATQAANTSTASGLVGSGFLGTVAAAQASQTSTASGVLGYVGTVNVTQAGNVAAASGKLGYTGTVARVQGNQISTVAGVVANPITGTAAVVQGNQFASASGSTQPLVLFGTATAGVGSAPRSAAAVGAAPSASGSTTGVPTSTGA